MKKRLLGLAGALLLSLGLPNVSSAIPLTWNYSGVCTGGDCGVVPTITGTLNADPALFGSSTEINEYILFGDLLSYNFSIGSYNFSGARGLGSYTLDSAGNIVGGTMTFGNFLALEFLGVGSATWHITDTNCSLFRGCSTVDAIGTGGYTTTSVPEPTSIALLGLGLLGLAASQKRRRC